MRSSYHQLLVVLFVASGLLVAAPPVIAHPGHAESVPESLSTWRVSTSGTTIQASLYKVQGDRVWLVDAADKITIVKLADLDVQDQERVQQKQRLWAGLNHQHVSSAAPREEFVMVFAPEAAPANAPSQATPFQKFEGVKTRWNDKFLFVESNGLPAHPMMKGITNWQQQVPLPQKYFGDNAWRLPLQPVVAKTPAMIKGRFLRGAIALAVNGIPIFNPQNNRGEVSQEIGELDDWGGHCGRADDYHYHATPLHLQEAVGKGQPVAYALDGYPIYGLTEPDGSPVKDLDECHGHTTSSGYHYHAATKYPYVLAGFHGEVVEREQQVDPQPRANPIRPAMPPLPGAKITELKSLGDGKSQLSYEVRGRKQSITYSPNKDGGYNFAYTDSDGQTKEETYRGREERGGDRSPRGDQPPPRPGETRPPRREDGDRGPNPRPNQSTNTTDNSSASGSNPLLAQAPPADAKPGENRPRDGRGKPDNKGLIKPQLSDTVKVNIYADNWFVLFINGELVAVDSIKFTPHNVVSVDILPEYPMTIAVMAKDNADPKTGLEYGDHIGDGGFIIKFSDGTVSNAKWKAKSFFKGPLNRDVKNPKVEHTPIPDKWWTVDFDDSKWNIATEYTEERVNPKEHFYKFDFSGAKFIWSDDLDLDNTVIFRTKVEKPGWKPRWNTKPDLDISGAPFK